MRSNYLKTLKTAVLAVSILLLAMGVASAQQIVGLTAGASTVTLPDGSTVPMWGYTCAAVAAPGAAGCRPLNPTAIGWSPVVITVPTGTPGGLEIDLTNHLPAPVPTSLTIVGLVGGGLGSGGTTTGSVVHPVQGATWPAADPGTTNTPPAQGPRVQSFSTEVANGAGPIPLTWSNLKPGTYLIESGTHPSIQGPMGLYGILVVTTAPASGNRGVAYSSPSVVNYDAEVPLLLSEIDPAQNNAVATAVMTPGFSEAATIQVNVGPATVSGANAAARVCVDPGNVTVAACYPPAVNYSPRYYLVNGVPFNRTNGAASVFPVAGAAGAGTGLVRIVNAGLRMHVPSIVGATTGSPAAPGLGLIAQDGNPLPGVTRVQSEVFLAAGKTYDVVVNLPAGPTALPIFDRSLGLSASATVRDAGMLAYIGANGGVAPVTDVTVSAGSAQAYYCVAGTTLRVSDPAKGVLANATGANGAILTGNPADHTLTPFGPGTGSLTLNTDGTFVYSQDPGNTSCGGTFNYLVNGSTAGSATITQCDAASHTIAACWGGAPTAVADAYTSHVGATSTLAASLHIGAPGVLENDSDPDGHPLTATIAACGAAPAGVTNLASGVTLNPDGSFDASVPPGSVGQFRFCYNAVNSQKTPSAAAADVTLTFPAPSNLAVTLVDGLTKVALAGTPQDYRWIIEEDRTFYVDPNCQKNPMPAGCPTINAAGTPPNFGTNFHTSYMPVVAQGCTGTISCETGQKLLGADAVCDVGNGACRTDATSKTPVDPGQAVLDPAKRYYISVLPGDAMDPGHAMGGAQIAYDATAAAWKPATVIVDPESQHAANLSVFVFEDDHPLNGEHDAGGGIDQLSPNEPGLGGFNITILDLVGMSGDSAGQLTYDEFNQPLSNALAGTTDPTNPGVDACPISKDARVGFDNSDGGSGQRDGVSPTGLTGVIPVCPKYESDGVTLSPLAGQAIVANLPPGRYGIVATPGADRIARGEEWLQTNTLDGGPDLEAFLKVNEPTYFQEFGPGSFHVSMGFANPAWIRDSGTTLCTSRPATATEPAYVAPDCSNTVTGKVTGVHMSRPSDERLYSTGTRDTFGYTQCYVSLGSPDGADISFAKCADDGTFTLTGVPAGDWRVTVFDQWNDQIVDGITTPVRVGGDTNMGDLAVNAWKNNLSTRTFIDLNGDGVSQDNEPGLTFVPTNIRYRDGSISNLNSTDLEGFAGFNEVFPIFNWYVMETSSTRYKNTGTHVINDAGGPVDNSVACGGIFPACGTSGLLANLARTKEDYPLPLDLRIPGAVYCDNADCSGFSITDPSNSSTDLTTLSTGRIDPPTATSYGWQSFMGQNQYLEFGKKPFGEGENGGIQGHVIYTSTRPFDDPALLLQLTWEPMVPHVKINLYQEGTAADGSKSLKLVDHTETSSWDDFAQGFHLAADGTTQIPNMNCPGQAPAGPAGLFMFTLYDQPNLLNPATALPYHSQFKCYDGMQMWNQLQPAPYDGMYQFPSVTSVDPTTGKPNGTNCTICVANPSSTDTTNPNYDPFHAGLPMLPAGKYVVEMILPPGYELVKEEDKNILLGDTYEAPVTQQFAGFGNIFILPDQASVAAYNPNNPLIPNTDEGVTPRHEGDTGSIETFWPCVGAPRVVPDFMSLYPQSGQNAPFAGATRNLCDRKEVTLEDQMTVLAKFYVFTSTHVAAHYTGIITDDFTSEFDPFSPRFGEKFSPANLPVGVRDWAGNEIARVYSDQWGIFDGLNYSSFSVNPPDPSGYIPQMMVMCMNDRGTGVSPDPFYQSSYSQFCYEWSFMPGQTSYLDTPVIPTTAFAEGYNHPDCAYPDATPAIAEVDGDGGVGPYLSATGASHTLTIKALGDQQVNNYGYSGPQSSHDPYNLKTINRHYGFGGTQGTGSVTIGGVTATVTGWSDTQITVTLPTSPQVPLCAVQQQAQYGGSAARCGELVITAGNGKRSVDTVTVTIGGKAPTRLAAGQTIQSAIDAARPGDLIIVPAGTYHEMVVMWKPVRLQGVGAASSIIDANAHPAGVLLTPWRQRVVCLFGLAPTGVPAGYDPGCGAGWRDFTPTTSNPQVDRLPLEATVGWDASLNGNLAEQLQEPTLLGAYEGAGITVLSKGVRVPNGQDPWSDGAEPGGFPAGTTLLIGTATNPQTISSGDANPRCRTSNSNATNPFPSNFQCNPSRIDGLAVTNSSQGGGGVFVHGWAHNLEISNNRVYNNQGTLAGGIAVGQGEHPPAYLAGAGAVNSAPGSCRTDNGVPTNTQLPYCFNVNVIMHHNAITNNASEGDELFAATPSGAGGAAFCTGDDYYKFNYNWVCGNMSTGDGAGFSQMGFVWHSSSDATRGIQHNTILFNQSTNPTTPSNGGGLLIMSAPDTDPTCPGEPDVDCNHAWGTVGDGLGPNLLINANLILGNAAEAGAGGGIRFQGVNGVEVSTFPTGSTQNNWYSVNVTNNIIANNVAGWDGAGVSLQDSLVINLVNNTIVSNDSTASSGALFGAFFATQASAPTPCPPDAIQNGGSGSCVPLSVPQPAGVSSAGHSAEFMASLPANITCPPGHGIHGGNPGGRGNGDCRFVSYPVLNNDVIWQNRAFNIVVGGVGPDTQNQQNVVTLAPPLSQTYTGQCFPLDANRYWDIGFRGDANELAPQGSTPIFGPNSHLSGYTLAPTNSVLSNITSYPGNGNTNANPMLVSQYCNGSRVPPENPDGAFGKWFNTPPGTNEGNLPVPLFTLQAGATVDEGNNWINISWGPLSMENPSTHATLANFSLGAGSSALDSAGAGAPADDFFGTLRPQGCAPDIGAIEVAGSGVCVTPTSLAFGNVVVGATSSSQNLTLRNTGAATFTGLTVSVSAPFTRSNSGAFPGGAPNCGASLAAGASCTIKVVFSPTVAGGANGSVTITGSVTVSGSPVTLTGTGIAPVVSASLTPAAWTTSATRGCTLACPVQVFTLTNTGNVTLTGITQGVLGGTNASEFSIFRPTSTCGPAGGGQALGQTTLAPGNSCVVTVRFTPVTSQTTGVKNATVSVTDAAGTQSSTLTGTAN